MTRYPVQVLLLFTALLLLLLGATTAETDFSITNGDFYSWNQTEWSLSTTRLVQQEFQARMSLANGYVGASLDTVGPFFAADINKTDPAGPPPTNGWALNDPRISFTTIQGFFDVQKNGTFTNYPWLQQYGWESFISGIPHATSLLFSFSGQQLNSTVDNSTLSNFSSKIVFKGGVGEWSETWTPAGGNTSFDVHYTAFFSRKRPNVVVTSAEITASADINGTVTDLLDGRSAVRSYLNSLGMDESTIYTSIHPSGLANKTAYLVSGTNASAAVLGSRRVAKEEDYTHSNMTIGQTFDLSLKKGQKATFYKYVGVASNDAFADPEATARAAQKSAQEDGYDALLAEHIAAWEEILPEDKVDDFRDPATGELPDDLYVQQMQISSVAHSFYLLQNMMVDGSGLNDWSVSVSGLVSDSYAGLVFWDAPYWMAPGVNVAHPQYSKQIINFDEMQFPQAKRNAEFWDWPEGSALYSWTAGRYGNCTGTGPCIDYEYHKNFDIAFNILQMRNITNNATWFDNGPHEMIDAFGLTASHLLQWNATTKTYWIKNMTDPDEYANNVDNGAFTIASSALMLEEANDLRLQQGLPINETWDYQRKNIAFPKAPSGITLEYQTMNNSVSVKQADVVLLTYPLGYGIAENYSSESQVLDLDYYANKQSPNGPGMTYSIFAAVSNALSQSGSSTYTYGLQSTLPYMRAPFFQMSEQLVDDPALNGGTNPAYPFLTGHGGGHQVGPFGWLGMRTDQEVLYINPSLPPQIPHLSLRSMHYAGATFKAILNSTHTVLTRRPTPSGLGLIDKYANTSMPFAVGPASSNASTTYHTIAINETVTIPNRLYWQTLTYPGNLLQNLPVNSTDAITPGQFALAAVDGASSTRWQPSTNSSASLTINTTSIPYQPITSLVFDWGTRPPKSAFVYLTNSSSSGLVAGDVDVAISVLDIMPNMEYNSTAVEMETLDDIVPVVGNSTSVKVTGNPWSGRYVRLVVEGCWEEDGAGATVGEFVMVGS